MITDLSKIEEFYKVKLTKKQSSHNNVRTNEIVGYAYALPQEGDHFCMFSEGLEMGVRIIKTTPIVALTEGEFKTQNSTYGFEVIEEKIEPETVENYLNHNLKNNIPYN